MAKAVYVDVNSDRDEIGNLKPIGVKWSDGREFNIERVIHVCSEGGNDSNTVMYTVLIAGKQKHLYRECNRWYVMT